MEKIKYGIIGGGWRAEFYIRIAQLVPKQFALQGIYVRNKQTAGEIENKYGVKTVQTIEELKCLACDFFVNCIEKSNITDLSFELANEGYAILQETPACIDEAQAKRHLLNMKSNYKIQVAEQFHLKPMYQAIKRIIDENIIGDIHYINISLAHEYHAMSLIKYFSGVNTTPTTVSYSNTTPILHTNGRQGEIDNKTFENSKHIIKIFDFGSVTALYDFDAEQYFSPIRNDHLLIRGTMGEIENETVRYFNLDNQFVENKIIQYKSGKLDGFYSDKITFENRVCYKSPFSTSRLSDEETAIATALLKMNDYIKFGKSFYNLQDAINDVLYWNGNE